jgi:hypothetical protein
MSREEWTDAYRDAWTTFYSFDHMKRALLRQNPHTYWGMFKCFLWYRASIIEGAHPMVTGFFRLKDRQSRRPGLPIEPRGRFLRRRVPEIAGTVRAYAGLLVEMQELWLATRIAPEEYAIVGDLRALRTQAAALLDVKAHWSRAHAAMSRAIEDRRLARPGPSAVLAERLEALRRAMAAAPGLPSATGGGPTPANDDLLGQSEMPSTFAALRPTLARLGPLRPPTLEVRRALDAYWGRIEPLVRSWHVWRLNPFTLAWNALRDLRHLLAFLNAMGGERF